MLGKTTLRSNYGRLLLLCLSLGLFFLYDYQLRLLPSLVDSGVSYAYHLESTSYGYLYGLYYVIYLPLQLLFGVWVDRYPLTRIIAVALLCSALGCYFFANAELFWLAELGRVFMGLGGAFVFVSTLKAVSVRFAIRRFGFSLGLVLGCGMLGVVLADMLMLWVLNNGGWRLVCYLLALVGLMLVLLNYVSFFSSVELYRATVKKAAFSDDIKQLVSYLKDRRLLMQSAVAALLYMPLACFAEAWGIRFFDHTYQFSRLLTMLDISMLFVGLAMGALVLGWIYDKSGEYQLLLMIAAVSQTILVSIFLYVPELSALKIAVVLLLLGFFSGSLVVILALNRRLATRRHAGKVFGVTNFFMMLSSLSAVLVGIVLHVVKTNMITELLPFYSISSYQVALLLLPCASMLAVFLTFFVGEGLGVSNRLNTDVAKRLLR